MYSIDEVLISDDVLDQQFTCNLEKCQGACCWKGDFGAPLEEDELEVIKTTYPDISGLLGDEACIRIADQGLYTAHPEGEGFVTSLMEDGACVFMTRDNKGIAKCTFEIAFHEGMTDFVKPISCHLYPLRISRTKATGFEAINYDRWDICAAACQLGRKLSMPVFRFVKTALIRKYGQEFYDKLETIYRQKTES